MQYVDTSWLKMLITCEQLYINTMKAIDFTCFLMMNLIQEEVSPTEVRVLMGMTSGLNTSRDLAERLDIRTSACTQTLQRLMQREWVLSSEEQTYTLTPAGQAFICRLLTFPRNRI